MTDEQEAFVLGDDVTESVRARGRRDSVVVSVRLSPQELKAVDQIARQNDKSLSQVIREAVRAYVASGPRPASITISSTAQTISLGGRRQQTAGAVERLTTGPTTQ